MNWKVVHAAMMKLAKSKSEYDAEEAPLLIEAARHRVWVHVGLGSLTEYLERFFGYSPRQAMERLRVAKALEKLPVLREQLASGQLPWTAVRELSRVATAETEPTWVEAAQEKTVHQIEKMVAGHKEGDWPDDPVDPAARRHTVRFDVSADTFAALREARQEIERELGHRLEDDEFLQALAERAIAPGSSDRRPRHQIMMTVCSDCGRGARDAAGESIAVEAASVEVAQCDARVIETHVGSERARSVIPDPTRRVVLQRDHGACVVPGCRASKYVDIHHIVWQSRGGTHERSNLVVLCSSHHDRVHEGRLHITGTAPDGLQFTNADGAPYGTVPAPAVNPNHRRDAALALHTLGFNKAASRRAADAATGDTIEAVIRSALQYAHFDVGLGARTRVSG